MAHLGSENPSADASPACEGLEYRSSDEAWYNVQVSLQGEFLNIKYSMLSGSPEEELHDPKSFKSLDDVLRFRNRFRALSVQVQDSECRNIVPGVRVCASYRSGQDDLRYYDAVVEQVDRNAHSYKKEEEQCLCSFILFWEHGPGVGELTTATVEDICLCIDGEIDHTVSEFTEIARMMVTNATMHSGFPLQASGGDLNRESQSFNVFRESGDEKEIAGNQDHITDKENEDYCETLNQDTDMGGIDMTLKKFLTDGYTYAVVIDNLEKDLTPLTVTKFILKETTINSRAHIFPSLLTDMYTRGVIEVNSREEFIELNDFLENTNQIIVSSHNRPWVVTKRLCHGEVRTIMPTSGGQQIHTDRSHSELKIVQSGTLEYNMAKQHRENFADFYSHVQCMTERLAFEEQKIISRWTTN